MDKSGAQMIVERRLGKEDALLKHAVLLKGERVKLKIAGVVRSVQWSHPYLKTSDPQIRIVEARERGGQWADPAEFIWTALAAVLIDNPHKLSAGPNCISIFMDAKTHRVKKLSKQ